ncbi:MAG: UrcA family protein [Sphingobium sp.]|uniref:UrcA family protein n=1 Tax=Sphingobium sp. TaxID=1912891 RepID=UPI0029BE4176|nr:UrcA family protein [Sphingobium sp.]MDX3909304.1 UrcA family protein [Sphingobium sp.]
MFKFPEFGRAFAVIAVPALAMASPAAMAEPDINVSYAPNSRAVTQTTAVDISDLQLNSAKGRHTAERRIVSAVKTVCSENRIFSTDGKRDYARCFAESRAKAMADAGLVRTASR